MSAKHTPGPWVAREWHDRDHEGECTAQGWTVTDRDGHRVPLCSAETTDLSEAEANALLQAAAPDMLEALLDARQCIHLDRVALADAHTGPDGLDEDGALAVGDYDAVLARIDAAIAKATGEQV
jgi:hypothetical protein